MFISSNSKGRAHATARFQATHQGDARRASSTEGHIPRISRLMALAIRFEQLIRDGVVKDQADLARLARISRARVTQIMDLLLLAPEIQEEILFLPPVVQGKDRITERHMRRITRESSWLSQKGIWRDVTKLSS